MQFLHCAAHLPLIANYREPATRQASKELCNYSQTISTLSCAPSFTCKICQVPVTPLPGKVSPNCRCYVSLPKRNHLPKKSPDSSQTCRSHLSPHPGILPPQVAKQLHKNAQLIYIRNITANSCTQLYVCLYHMILVMSFLYFQ